MKWRLVFLLLLAGASLRGQSRDSVYSPIPSDTLALTTLSRQYSPRKALLYAAVLPGLGQIYTKKYWKIPLVYGGLGATGYAIRFYQQGYTKYRAELFDLLRTGAPTSNSGFTETQLRTLIDRYRRERDFMIIVLGGVYVLQMIDAHVDAHLKEFDVNPRFKVSFLPTSEQNPVAGRITGVGLFLKF
jgi:hypothetical protein